MHTHLWHLVRKRERCHYVGELKQINFTNLCGFSYVQANRKISSLDNEGPARLVQENEFNQYLSKLKQVPNLIMTLYVMRKRSQDVGVGSSSDLFRDILDAMPRRFLVGEFYALDYAVFFSLWVQKWCFVAGLGCDWGKHGERKFARGVKTGSKA